MQIINLEKMADSNGENPYYLAFAIENGFDSSKKAFDYFGSNEPFMSWNNDRWIETMKRIGETGCRPIHHNEHIKTLEIRLGNYYEFIQNKYEKLKEKK